jgi:two-component system, OmpR family, KDP operon response regulator KdpE
MRVLIVEDERDISEGIALTLRFQWPSCETIVAADGVSGIEALRERVPDLVLLDIRLPRQDGFETLRQIRQASTVPVVIITACGEELDKVRGLEGGADDYITKPFSHLELLARVKAVLRRAELPPVGLDSSAYDDGYLLIDYARRLVQVNGAAVALTPTEYNLLAHLARNATFVLPHRMLLGKVWGEEYESETDYLRVYVRRLREKIERAPDAPEYIHTERGIGYRFVPKKPPDRSP